MNRGAFVALCILALLLFLGGAFYIGWHSKKCQQIINYVDKHDTICIIKTIHDTIVPPYKPIHQVHLVQNTVYKHDSIHIYETICGAFDIVDTLRHNGLYVSIHDIGDCNGINSRSPIWGGVDSVMYVTNTVTKTISQPPKFLSLYAGASGMFNKKFGISNFYPTIGVSLLDKYLLAYGYGIANGSSQITMITKIR